jgi:hypothetical protein
VTRHREGRPAEAAPSDDPSRGQGIGVTLLSAGTEILPDRIDRREPPWIVEQRHVEARARVAAMDHRRRVLREVHAYFGEAS